MNCLLKSRLHLDQLYIVWQGANFVALLVLLLSSTKQYIVYWFVTYVVVFTGVIYIHLSAPLSFYWLFVYAVYISHDSVVEKETCYYLTAAWTL